MSPSRRRPHQPLLGNHQRSWIWGRNAVTEAVRSDRWRPLEVQLADDLPRELHDDLERWCAEGEIACNSAPSRRLRELCHANDHQGLIARMPEYPYLSFEELRDNLTKHTLLLVLDRLHDAFNFGACLRCAEVFGVDAVIVGAGQQASVNSQVVRSSAGAIHHLPIVRHGNLTEGVAALRQWGVSLVGATEKADRSLVETTLRRPLAIVVGNEGCGIDAERLALCDQRLAIPQSGRVGSLNVAVATGILLYEAIRQTGSPAGGAT